MLWFYEAFFPVVWIFFLIYWQIKAANTKATQRLEFGSLAHLARLHFPDRDRPALDNAHPAALALPAALAAGAWALLDGSSRHHRRAAVRRLGARAPRQKLEPLGDH